MAVSSRRRLLRWAGWFAVANAGPLAIIGLRYLWLYVRLSPSGAWSYALLAYVGHVSALAYLPCLLVLVPVILLSPWPRLVMPLGVAMGSIGGGVLLLGSPVFSEDTEHTHRPAFMLLAPETWGFLGFYIVVGVAIEGMLAGWVWQRTARPPARRMGRYLALGLGACFVASHLIHAWAVARYDVPVTSFTRYLPLYYPLQATELQVKLGLVDQARARDRGAIAALGGTPAGELRYPLAPLRCEPRAPRLHVLLVVIDAMRADVLTAAVAPRLTEFARGAIQFDQHTSGGNSSRAGMFSLFYGIPATYWNALANPAQPPVMMDLFRQHNYQLGLFVSVPLDDAVGLDRTAFARVPDLRLRTSSRYRGWSGKDRGLTDEWYGWLDRRDPARPFFGFLYYNAAVALDPPDNYPAVAPVAPVATTQLHRYARYLSALHYVDSLVGQVLDDLDRRKLRESTVVLVTSDHGMEFDENGEGFAGHGTSYSRYQVHTPLVVGWPGRPPGRVARRTSHYDVAPTLVSGLFGCANPGSDYASGRDLFSDGQWDWFIAASYREFALIEPERGTIIHPGGYEIRDRDYRLVASP